MPRPKYPKKLASGDEVRVVAFADSLFGFDTKSFDSSRNYLRSLGLELSLGEHARRKSLSVSEKIEDFHRALSDKKVRMIIAAGGGFDSNEILSEIDYGLVSGTAKIIQGYSDITAVLNAITTKTGLVTYYGPNYGGLSEEPGSDYTRKHLESIWLDKTVFEVHEHVGLWYEKDYSKRPPKLQAHRGAEWWQLGKGIGLGKVVAGHLGTLRLLLGTKYAPKLKGSVLCIEADADYRPEYFRRELIALSQVKGFERLEGLLIGRFPSKCNVDKKWLERLIDDVPELKSLPVIANIDFGHTNPKVTLPIGGEINIRSQEEMVIRVTEH